MFKIVKKRQLSDKVILMDIEAKRVAKKCLPGEFVIVKANEKGERIPLTVCDYNRDAGTVTIVFQTVGFSTELFGRYNEGDYYADFVGPLGNPSELVVEDPETLKDKKILFVGGGLGIAPVYPQVKWLHEHGIACDSVIGARNADLLILREEMEAVSDNLYIATDDGSIGQKGLVTDVIKQLVTREKIRSVCDHRSYDHDEIRVQSDKRTWNSHCCKYESHHGRRHRNVWCLQAHSRR